MRTPDTRATRESEAPRMNGSISEREVAGPGEGVTRQVCRRGLLQATLSDPPSRPQAYLP